MFCERDVQSRDRVDPNDSCLGVLLREDIQRGRQLFESRLNTDSALTLTKRIAEGAIAVGAPSGHRQTTPHRAANKRSNLVLEALLQGRDPPER